MKMNCPSCDQHLDVPNELAGQSISCPTCSKNFTVQDASPETSSPVQSNLKISQPAKKTISRQQTSQAMPSEDVLRNLSENVRHGSPGAMHAVSHLTGSNTPLRETAASSFSGPVTKVLFGVGIALFILFKLGGGIDFGGSTAKVQNRLASIEKDMIDGLNTSETIESQGKVVAEAVAELRKIKISKLDKEYQTTIQEYITALHKWSVALKRGDAEKADEYDDLRLDATYKLNEISKAKGRYN